MLKNNFFFKTTTLLSLLISCFSAYTHAQVSGTAFRDYNENGIRDLTGTITAQDGNTIPTAIDAGIAGVTVSAYDAAGGLITSTTSASDGAYTLSGVTGQVRIEFSGLPAGYHSTFNGTSSPTSVQFVTAPATVNFGINRPYEYVEDNPALAVGGFTPLSHTGVNANNLSVLTIPNTAGSTTYLGNTSCIGWGTPCPTGFDLPTPTTAAVFSQVGGVFGLGWQAKTKTLFAGSYVKILSDLGPQGTGAIYRIDMSNPSSPVVLTGTPNTPNGPIDLNLIFGANTCGTNPFAPSYPDFNLESERQKVGDAVYNTAFADIDVSEDGTKLYALSFADKKLYVIPIDGSPINASTVQSYTIPVMSGETLSTVRGTAIGQKDGLLYIMTQGHFIINDANTFDQNYTVGSSSGVRYQYLGNWETQPFAVYTFNTQTNSFSTSPILSFTNYTGPVTGTGATNEWLEYEGYMVMDIVFDTDGAMIMGGRKLVHDVKGGTLGARLLKACPDGSGNYVLEDNSSCGGNTTAGTDLFYFEVDAADGGTRDAMGGLAQIPGTDYVIETAYDIYRIYSAGVRWLSNTDGTHTKGVESIPNTAPTAAFAGITFGNKTGVLGDIEILASPAPLEIGNRVWTDTDSDGIQDADEAGIDGVTVQLYEGATLVGSTTTANGGQWFFNKTNVNQNGATEVKPNTAYTVRVLSSAFPSGQTLTTTNSDGSSNGDLRDSDAALVSGNAEIAYTTGEYGENDHTLDMGFRAAAIACPTVTNPGDCNNNTLPNSTLEDGTFTATGTFVGSPYKLISNEGTTLTDWWVNKAYWVDAQNTGGGHDGSCRLVWLDPSYGNSVCIYPIPQRSLVANQCYTMSIWAASFDPNNPTAAQTMSFDIVTNSSSEQYIIIDNNGGGTVSYFDDGPYGVVSTTINLSGNTAPLDMSGNPFTNAATQTLDWSSLNWQLVTIRFHVTQNISADVNYSINDNTSNGVVVDNPVFGSCCSQPCTLTVDSAVPTTCNPATNTYNLAVNVTYNSQPTGNITINVGGTNYPFTPDGTSPDTYTVTGLTSNGATGVDVSATFVGDNTCTHTLVDAYNAPINCGQCNFTITTGDVECHANGTPEDATDDYIIFTLNASNTLLGSLNYTVTATQAGNPISITLSNGSPTTLVNCGINTPMRTPAGTAGDGPITLTITDNVHGCSSTTTVNDPGSCTVACTTGTPSTVSYSYTTQVDITELETLPLIIPKFDDNAGTRILNSVTLDYEVGLTTSLVIENSASNPQTYDFNINGDAYLDLDASTIATPMFFIDGPTLNFPAGVAVPAQGSWPGDISNSTIEGMLPWLTNEKLDIFKNPTTDPRWVTNATGNVGTDDDIVYFPPTSDVENGSITYTLPGDLNNFIGIGNVPLSVTTLTGIQTSGGGGNMYPIQRTRAYASVNVSYTYQCAVCSVTVTAATPTTCNPATNTYNLDVAVTYSTQPTGDITINVGGTDYTFTPDGTSPDTYTVTGLSSNGTQDIDVSATFVGDNTCTHNLVDAYDAPVSCACNLTASADGTNVLCNGGTDGTATATASGNIAAVTYAWSNGGTTAIINNLAAGTYTVTITESATCTAVSSYTVTEPPIMDITCDKTDVTTNGGADGTASVVATGGTSPYTYLWNTSETTATISGKTSGTYTVTVTDANGCTALCNSTINEPGCNLSATADGTNVLCNGGTDGTATATASGNIAAVTYAWSNGGTTASISNLAAGTYTVTITETASCTAVASYTVTEPPVMDITCDKTDVTTNGGSDGTASVVATGGTSPYTYLWNSNETTASINSKTSGTYTVTVTDANGCTALCNSTINEPGCNLSATADGTNVLCNGGTDGTATATASGNIAAVTYAWSSGGTTATISNLAADTYSVTISETASCTAVASYTVTEPPVMDITCDKTDVTTNGGSDGTATVSATGGTSPYTYLWDSGETTATISGKTSGTYTVTVTDANGCTDVCNSTINEPGCNLSATADGTNVLCNGGTDGTATATASGNIAAVTYLWSNGETTATISNLAADTYSVTISETASCTAVASYTVTEPPVMDITCNQTDVTTNGGADGTASVVATGGTSPYAYLWNSGETTASISGKTSATYTVTVTDANGCTDVCASSINEPGALCNLIGAGLAGATCNDNGTSADATDDYISFTLNPTGTTLGSGYIVTVSSGSVTPNIGTYGTPTTFQLQNGSAGSGSTITVTITDASDTNCKVQVDVADPGSCSTPTCPPVKCLSVTMTKQ